MRKSFFSILAVLALAVPALAADAPKFVLSDGYVQADGQMPHHLTHGPVPELKVSLGGGLNLWFAYSLAKGATSPCTARDEEPCYFEYRLAPPGADKEKIDDYSKLKFRTSEGPRNLSMGYPIIREATLGHRVFYVRIRYNKTVHYLAEVPVEVVE